MESPRVSRAVAGVRAAGMARDAGRRTGTNTPIARARLCCGTAGGPSPKCGRAAPASVVLVDRRRLRRRLRQRRLARQMVLAGVELNRIRDVFITHHHSGITTPTSGPCCCWPGRPASARRSISWGPPPIHAQMVDLFLQMSAPDIDIRIADEGRPPLEPLIRAHDVREVGTMREGRARRRALRRRPSPDGGDGAGVSLRRAGFDRSFFQAIRRMPIR